MSKVGAVLVAAGSSKRAGGSVPKQFQLLGTRPMFVVALDALLPACDEVVVVVPAGEAERALRLLTESGVGGAGGDRGPRLKAVVGGERRQDSVRRGLEALSPGVEIVLVHDAARPFASRELVACVIAAAETTGAAVPAVSVAETVKRVEDSEEGPRVLTTLDRSLLRLAQTPQGFRRGVLDDAYRAVGDADVTDDASVIELAGLPVAVVDGEPTNVKITTAADLEEARARANRALKLDPAARVGVGFDFHRLVRGRDLVLGGVAVPFDRGLDGHSDADVATHAVCDALLGAAAAGDIGVHFPPGDPRFKGVSSLTLLRRVAEIVRDRGFAVGSIDVTIVAEAPRLSPLADEMRRALAGALGIDAASVSVKATTTEGAGPEGRGEGMSARAVAVVRKREESA
jgi:2-C-methyl-D-erythritol 4-phosphate cytidylyltransferase/2-C-methyl-D-erythritol 2,4-cyclodiphosphate synthase